MKLDEDSESECSEIPGDHECEEKVYLQAERASQVADRLGSDTVMLSIYICTRRAKFCT